MKVALCEKRNFPPVKRQDMITFLPAEAMYDLIETVEVSSDSVEVINYKDNFYVKQDIKYDSMTLYKKSSFELV